MKKGFKCLAMMTVVFMLSGILLSGCVRSEADKDNDAVTKVSEVSLMESESKIDISKPVKLSMYLIGEAPRELGQVMEELNKHISEDINATLEINYISKADSKMSYPLLFASGETFDMIFTARWLFFEQEAGKGGFMAIDELLPVYAPVHWKEMPKEAWDEASLDGKIYMVPNLSKPVNANGIVIRGDLRKKYGVPEVKNLKDLGVFLDAIARNEKGMVPLNLGGGDQNDLGGMFSMESNAYVTDGITNTHLTYSLNDSEPVITKITDTKDFDEYLSTVRDWAQKGYWTKNVLSNKTRSIDAFQHGTSAAAVANLATTNVRYKSFIDENPDWEIEWIPIYDGISIKQLSWIQNGIAINANAKNPERSLMLLELLKFNQKYYDLTFYGIKGKHYELTKDGSVALPSGMSQSDNGFAPLSMAPEGWKNDAFTRIIEGSLPTYSSHENELRKKAVRPALLDFKLNMEPIKNELAALMDVAIQYMLPLQVGLVDPVEGKKILAEKQKVAGIDKVKAEVEKQMKEFLEK